MLMLSSAGDSGTSGHPITGPRVSQNDSNHTRVPQHALVLGSDQHVGLNPSLPAKGGESFNDCPHRDLLNLNLHA